MSPRWLVLAVLLLVSHPAHAWRVHLGAGTYLAEANAVALSPSGDVVAGGTLEPGSGADRGLVVALTRAGLVRWRHEIGTLASAVGGVTIDARGDVYAGGAIELRDDGERGRRTVTKLDSRTGAVVWRDPMRFDYPEGTLRLTSNDDVVVGGYVAVDDGQGGGLEPRSVLRRLAGGDGSEQWRVADGGLPVLVDPTGVYTDARRSRIAKRSLDDGHVLWESADPIDSPLGDGAGDVVGLTNEGVRKVAGADGTTRWSRDLADVGMAQYLHDHAVDAAGAVIVAGFTPPTPQGHADLVVAKLAAADGGTEWVLSFDGDGPLDVLGVVNVGVDRTGNVVVAARIGELGAGGGPDVAVLSLRGTDGALRWFQHLPGDGGTPWALATGRSSFFAVAGQLAGPDGAGFMVARLSARSGRGARRVRVY